MKKVFLTMAAVCGLAFASQAQTSQGAILLNGSIDASFLQNKTEFDGVTVDGTKDSNFNLSPSVGYFVTDGLAVGLNVDIQSSSSKLDDEKSTVRTLVVGPLVRYYTEFGVFGLANAGLASIKFKDEEGSETFEEKASGFGWEIGVGYAAFLGENVAIEPAITYGGASFNFDEDGVDFTQKSSGLGINIGISVFLNN